MPRRQRVPLEVKSKTVLRVLAGEPLEALAAELDVSTSRITRWEQLFVAGGQTALKQDAETRAHGFLYRHRGQIVQWAVLIVVLVAATLVLTRLLTTGE